MREEVGYGRTSVHCALYIILYLKVIHSHVCHVSMMCIYIYIRIDDNVLF